MKPWGEPRGYLTMSERRRFQARPKWELERSLRRAALRRGVLIGVGGFALAVVAWGFLVILFSL